MIRSLTTQCNQLIAQEEKKTGQIATLRIDRAMEMLIVLGMLPLPEDMKAVREELNELFSCPTNVGKNKWKLDREDVDIHSRDTIPTLEINEEL